MRAALALALLAATWARGAAPELLVEAEITPAQVYVGGEALLRLRLLRAPGVIHGTLRPPEMGEAADVSLSGEVRIYKEQRAGAAYEVLERTHVIVPRRAGRLAVPGAVFEGALSYEVYTRATGTVPRTVLGPARELAVRPVPAGAGEPWLPARSLSLSESWSRDLDGLAAGTPVTRTLVLQAEGLAAERLPRLEMAPHPALLVHHDQPELSTEYLASGMTGRRVQRIVLMPAGAAAVELPALRVRWWDVGADAPRVAALAGRTLFLNAAIAPPAVVPPPAPVSAPAVLRWVLAAIVALAALAFAWVARTRKAREAKRKLRAACRANDARGARDALAAWTTALGAAPAIDRAQAGALDAALYGGAAWDGGAFWRAARRGKAGRRRAAPARSALPPFFRLQGLPEKR